MITVSLIEPFRRAIVCVFESIFRKCRKPAQRVLAFLSIIFNAPLVLLVVLIRPLVWIRFGVMRSDRIGHFIGDVEAYLCTRDLEVRGRRVIDIIGCPQPVCNRQVLSMWSRVFLIVPGGKLWGYVDAACMFWTRGEDHHVKLYGRVNDYWAIKDARCHLAFTEEEKMRGRELIRRLTIPPDAQWVCIHNRDSIYLDKMDDRRYAYHDYRNFSVQSLKAASDELVQRGYHVLRVGSVVSERFLSNNEKVLDYASSSMQSDFADIYLLANCVAYIGSDSGIACVPFVFHKPISFINFSSTLIGLLLDQDIRYPFIIKRIWHKERRRFLSLREIFECGLAGATETDRFEEVGVEPVCNTSEDIRDLAIEVGQRLKGRWQSQLADEEQQRRFWEIFRLYSPRIHEGEIRARIGSAFLRNHEDLLH